MLFVLSAIQTQAAKSNIDTIWPVHRIKVNGKWVNIKTYNHNSYKNVISDSFGPRRMNAGRYDFHTGVDFYTVPGYKVYAVADGKVLAVVKNRTSSSSNSNYVLLEHQASDVNGINFKFRTVYVHLQNENDDTYIDALYQRWQNGDVNVSQGDIIGRVGNTGPAGGHHLHFEVLAEVNGKTFLSGIGLDYRCAIHPFRILNFANISDSDTSVSAQKISDKEIKFNFSISDKHLGYNAIEIDVNGIGYDAIIINLSDRNDPDSPRASLSYKYAMIGDYDRFNNNPYKHKWDWSYNRYGNRIQNAQQHYNKGWVQYDFISDYREHILIDTNYFDETDDKYQFSYNYKHKNRNIGNKSSVKVVIKDADGDEIFRNNNVSIN